jgi:protein-S-isoprenylcysteine O-methyltransferase Ste14
MAGLIRLLMLLFIGRQAYERAKAQGAWSWKLFLLVRLAVAVVCGASIPLFIASGNALNAGHTFVECAGIGCAALLMILGIVLLAIWTKPQTKTVTNPSRRLFPL